MNVYEHRSASKIAGSYPPEREIVSDNHQLREARRCTLNGSGRVMSRCDAGGNKVKAFQRRKNGAVNVRLTLGRTPLSYSRTFGC